MLEGQASTIPFDGKSKGNLRGILQIERRRRRNSRGVGDFKIVYHSVVQGISCVFASPK